MTYPEINKLSAVEKPV